MARISILPAFFVAPLVAWTVTLVWARPAASHHKTAHVAIVTDGKTIGRYKPGTIIVHRGDRVAFKNVSDAPHTVSADTGAFDSGTIGIGKSWTYTAKRAGTYTYFCQFHGDMHGKLVVKP